MSAVPTDPDPLARLPKRNIGTDRVDSSRDFMSWHPWIFESGGPVTFFDEHIAVADAAGFHLDANLVMLWLGDGALADFKVSPRLRDLHDFHGFRHGGFLSFFSGKSFRRRMAISD